MAKKGAKMEVVNHNFTAVSTERPIKTIMEHSYDKKVLFMPNFDTKLRNLKTILAGIIVHNCTGTFDVKNLA